LGGHVRSTRKQAHKVRRVVFIPLALNQTRFFLGVAQRLRSEGISVAFVPVHEGSLGPIRDAGFQAVNFFEGMGEERPLSAAEDADQARAYGIENITPWLVHEMAAYGIRDSGLLRSRLVRCLNAMSRALAALDPGSAGAVVVQELGGFLPVVASFHVARARGFPNVFIEPSFFRGRVFLTADSFRAPRIGSGDAPVGEEVRRYLADTVESQRIVIPEKDRGHYRRPIDKILNRRNARRLIEKTWEKHVQGKREEFSHVGHHVRRHVAMLAKGVVLRLAYRELPEEPFVYYPFHVPADVALTLRSPEYLDQYETISYLARVVPPTHRIVVKEHPALIGALDLGRMRDLLRRHDNLVLADPSINNHRVIRAADAVVTINSKSGAEAILLGTPVVVLGDAFYRSSDLVQVAETKEELPQRLAAALADVAPPHDRVEAFYQRVWDSSWPGELYDPAVSNTDAFAESLLRFLPRLQARERQISLAVAPQRAAGGRA
jgi:hypothetical protein